MINQTIICETSLSYAGIEKWYGTQAAENVVKIAEILKPYCLERYKGIGFTMQQYVVSEEGGYVGRKMTNLIEGCPAFYPKKMERIPPNEVDGYRVGHLTDFESNVVWDITEQYSDARTYPAICEGPYQAATQYIITGQTLKEERFDKIFGVSTRLAVQELNEYLAGTNLIKQDIDVPPYMQQYAVYVVEQFDGFGKLLYAGYMCSNLIYGCPVFYPQYRSEFPANYNGGYKDVQLPDELLDKLWALDMSECQMEPLEATYYGSIGA